MEEEEEEETRELSAERVEWRLRTARDVSDVNSKLPRAPLLSCNLAPPPL
jgi:hypothetical protein